jgi:hypothetical protein
LVVQSPRGLPQGIGQVIADGLGQGIEGPDCFRIGQAVVDHGTAIIYCRAASAGHSDARSFDHPKESRIGDITDESVVQSG